MPIRNGMLEESELKTPYRVVARCMACETDIYEGDYFYQIDGDVICENCIRDYVKENFRRCIE